MRYIYQAHYFDGQGAVIAGGTVQVYLAGTTTPATIYAASSGGSAITSGQTTTGADGYFEFYIDDGVYAYTQLFDLILSKANFQTKSYPNVSIINGVTGALAPFINVKSYGAVADNSTDFGVPFNAAVAALGSTGGVIVIPPGNYKATTQPKITSTVAYPISVWAYGAILTTSGVISALEVAGNHRSVYGLTISQSGTSATYGINNSGGSQNRFQDIVILGSGMGANYAAVRIAGDATSFWNLLDKVKILGGTINDIPIGVQLDGVANATTIRDGSMGNCTTCIKMNYGTTNQLADSVLILGNDMSNYTQAIWINGNASSTFSGTRVIGNRFELGTNIAKFAVGMTNVSQPPYFYGNAYIATAFTGGYFVNPENIDVTFLDFSSTPSLIGLPNLFHGVIFDGGSGSDHPVTSRPVGSETGFHMESPSGLSLGYWSWITGNKTRLMSITGGVPNLSLCGVQGINGAGSKVDANNLRGTATFASAATKTVSFGTAEADANYYIALSGSANETFWVTSKVTGGFTLNSSNATSTAVVDWILIR